MNRDLAVALTFIVLALLGILASVAFKVYQAARPMLGRSRDDEEDDYGSELVDLGGGIGASNWRPL
jgi:hypothetical protein